MVWFTRLSSTGIGGRVTSHNWLTVCSVASHKPMWSSPLSSHSHWHIHQWTQLHSAGQINGRPNYRNYWRTHYHTSPWEPVLNTRDIIITPCTIIINNKTLTSDSHCSCFFDLHTIHCGSTCVESSIRCPQ